MASLTWERVTRQQKFWNVPLKHGDHAGHTGDGCVALVTRRVDGRWCVWIKSRNLFVALSAHHAIRDAKRRAERLAS